MTFEQPREVLIRHIGFGAVMIGDEPVAPAGSVTLDILGATLEFDPSRPDRLPSCLVADPGMAVPVLEQLYGNALADEVLARAVQRDDAVVTCPVVRQPMLSLLTRLAENRWCQRSAALPLDPALLLLEEMTLLAELRGIVDIDEDWVEELRQLLGVLMSRPDAVRAATAQPVVRALLVDALEVLVTESIGVGDDHAEATGWVRLVTQEPAGRDRPTVTVGWWEQLRPELALAAGAGSGRSTVDWGDVPLGPLSRREGNVGWQLHSHDGSTRITAEVASAGDGFWLLGEVPTLPGGLCFDVLGPGWPLPIATGELTLEGDGQRWRGAVELAPQQQALLERLQGDGAGVDLRVRGVKPGPRRDPLVAEAERWCARAVCALRLRNVVDASGLLNSAEESLAQAVELWGLADRTAELAATRDLLELIHDDAGSWTEALTVAETILVAEQD